MVTLGSGALLGSAVAAYQGKRTGEMALFRKLLKFLKDGDILLGDAIFENYFLMAMLQLDNIDVVFEKNGARHLDLRKCDQKLGEKRWPDASDEAIPPGVDEPGFLQSIDTR